MNMTHIVVYVILLIVLEIECGSDQYYCENQRVRLDCSDKNIQIVPDTVAFGLFDNGCAQGANVSHLPSSCIADPRYAYQLLASRCDNTQRCTFWAKDNYFQLDNNSCPHIEEIDSRLKLQFSCNVGKTTTLISLSDITPENTLQVSDTAADIDHTTLLDTSPSTIASNSDANQISITSESATLPIARPQPTFELCMKGESQVQDCYMWQCVKGAWLNVSITYNDSSCCSLWDGCQITTGNVSLFENVTTSPAETTTKVTAECPSTVSSYREFNITWQSKPAGMWQTADCPGDTKEPPSVARRLCLDTGLWDQSIDTSMCISPSLINVTSQDIESEKELADLTKDLAEVTESEELTANDVSYVITVLADVGDKIGKWQPTAVANITQDVLVIGNNLLNIIGEQPVETRSAEGMEVVAAVEHVAIQAAHATNSSIHVQSHSIELFVEVVNLATNQNHSISVDSTGGSIEFPITNLVAEKEGSDYGKLVTVFYNNSTKLWKGKGNRTVGSAVISISTVDDSSDSARRELNEHFYYTVKHNKHTHTDGSCVFWDETNVSRWSEEGCRRAGGSDDTTKCLCTHLTNFAVLLDTTGQTNEPSLPLSVITYVGCIVSIVCLFLSWMTFQCLKNLSSDRNTIHKHLVFNLMIAEILFLVAMSSFVTPHKIFCSVLAAVLHFLFLSVFSWTCLEGVQLYIMLIEVFEAERSRTLYYYLAGYGIPATVVGVSAAIGYDGYGREQICWLSTKLGFIWSFAAPVAAVMLINIIMLSLAIYMMYNHAKMVANMKHKESNRMDSIRAWIKGAAVLVVLLGLTWIFGFMYVSKETEFMAYIFTVLNSLQGLFIFIFHCAKNEKVQKEYKRYVRRAQWLPNCVRIRYGEHKGLSNVPSHSSSSNGYLSRYFSRRRKSSSDLTNGSVRLKKQISNLTSVNSNTDDESKEPLTLQHKTSLSNGSNEQQILFGAPTEAPIIV